LRKHDCDACALKPQCCPNVPARKIARSIHEAARDKARSIAKTEAYAVSRRERKKVEMLFPHLKRILRLDRLRLRGPSGAKDEFLLAATAQNLPKLAKLIPVPPQPSPHEAEWQESASLTAPQIPSAGATTGGSSTKSTFKRSSANRAGGWRSKEKIARRVEWGRQPDVGANWFARVDICVPGDEALAFWP
jgi:Transposase DDE domain